ncbi:LysE family transporter [Chakrabartyella piscis]|uniref:LysE family transporter n=1 Tax=Chakrabartyella piscis TaxID=2918914 RepID=UPI00295863BB|nr:LysE family transporter [Chakrabartyella piscis]
MFSWLHFLTYAAITAVTPGPNNIMSMSNASRLGFKKSFPFNLGIWFGFSMVMIVCTTLSSLLSSIIPKIQTAMLLIGAAYMLHLAYKTWKSNGGIQENNSRSGFLSGMFLQFVNPKIYIYCFVSMQAYILPYYNHNPIVLLGFALLLAFMGFVCTLLWAIFGSIFRALFSQYAKITNTIMALLLVYCAIGLFL